VSSTTKYDAHQAVLSRTYGAQAELRRELADSKSRVAEREELLRLFAGCADSQRAWLLLEDYFEGRSRGRIFPPQTGGRACWPRRAARLEELRFFSCAPSGRSRTN
jgi:hypothetical protein